jgi:hypothetical protein
MANDHNNYTLNADTGHFKVTGYDAKLIHKSVTETIKRNWWLIALYVAVNLAAIFVGAYILILPWLNALASFCVLIFSTWVGYVMMCKVVTITNEVR